MIGVVWPEVFFLPFALLCGFGLDLIAGDPERFPHPVRGMGLLIAGLERMLRPGLFRRARFDGVAHNNNSVECNDAYVRMAGETNIYSGNERGEVVRGAVLVVIVVAATIVLSFAAVVLSYMVHPVLCFAVCVIICWQCVSVRNLADEAGKVYAALGGDRPQETEHCDTSAQRNGDLTEARKALSRIVGRDVDVLDEEGVVKAALETVSENTADGVIAPLFYLAIGGPCLGLVYKAVNTMDSMIGYKNERYRMFGRPAARLDDVFGYVPARLGAMCLIVASRVLGRDGQGACRIWRRDGRKHASPNAGQCEAALAGALGVALAGDASYSGEIVRKPAIGDAGRPVAPQDIKTATKLLYVTALLFIPLAFFISCLLSYVFTISVAAAGLSFPPLLMILLPL